MHSFVLCKNKPSCCAGEHSAVKLKVSSSERLSVSSTDATLCNGYFGPGASLWFTSAGAAIQSEPKLTPLEEARQEKMQRRAERRQIFFQRHKGRCQGRSPTPEEAEPSQLPSRDSSSSSSGRAGQNAARAGPNASQGRTSLLRQSASGAAAKPGREAVAPVRGRSDRGEVVKGGLDTESPKSGASSAGGSFPKGPFMRAPRPSRLGPGKGGAPPKPAAEPMKNGRKRLLQVGACTKDTCHYSPCHQMGFSVIALVQQLAFPLRRQSNKRGCCKQVSV